MPRWSNIAVAAAIVMGGVSHAGAALAGPALADLPAPGIAGLVAAGVVAAIALARWRDK